MQRRVGKMFRKLILPMKLLFALLIDSVKLKKYLKKQNKLKQKRSNKESVSEIKDGKSVIYERRSAICNGLVAEYRKKINNNKKKIRNCKGVVAVDFILFSIVISILFLAVKEMGNCKKGEVKKIQENIVHDPKEILNEMREKEDGQSVKKILEEDLYYSWYIQVPEESRVSFYEEKIIKMTEKKEPISDDINLLDDDRKEKYDKNINELQVIEKRKIPEGATSEQIENGEVTLLELSAEDYQREYELRWECYEILASADMLQQAGKAASDYVSVRLKNCPEIDMDNDGKILEFARYLMRCYSDLIQFEKANESPTDCCYWIAKALYEIGEKMSSEHADYSQHCYLMAFSYGKQGIVFKGQEKVEDNHYLELKKLVSKMEQKLEIN